MHFLTPHLFVWFITLSQAHAFFAGNLTSLPTRSARPRPVHEDWPSVPGRPFDLFPRSLAHPARRLSRTGFMTLTHEIYTDVVRQIDTYGNSPIPSPPSPPLSFESRGIKFEISSFADVTGRRSRRRRDNNTEQEARETDQADTSLRWGDLIPLLASFRAKMSRDGAWRENAVWIRHRDVGVRVGTASLERAGPRAVRSK
ncbi:MAG: hypothetical protein LQ344_004772 [Seirophora lacunosa]|nr:MAG: hypothetical protein LQ344_004772 [Seirophora lacunosa]